MIRHFAWTAGVVCLVAGLLGFLPAVVTDTAGPGGLLFGLWPVAPLLSALYITLGAAGTVASSHYRTATVFARVTAVVFALLALVGVSPLIDHLPALAPLAFDVTWSSGLVSVIATYFGWGEPSRSYIAML